MMRTHKHMALGAVVAALPDVMLLFFGWRRTWLPEHHSLVRAHRFLHSRRSVLLVVALAWLSHIIADEHSPHRTGLNQTWKGEPR